ncbi:sensor histidine kinase [Mycetocola miduiensis]|uniref:histidine kinase n=1 Tax=Mycetocola miduiensis TaxID=995034 RepID=A0A1I5AYV2_9MICO|nr:hypothetical protein [Mycetocola miduiensis]SFN67643.1 Signal transduction histidine kinase [Mycetocola miduiensis]
MRFTQQLPAALPVLGRRALFILLGGIAAVPPMVAWSWFLLVLGDDNASAAARAGAVVIVGLMTVPVFLSGAGTLERRLVNSLLGSSIPEPGVPRSADARVRGSLFFAGHLAVGGLLVAAPALATVLQTRQPAGDLSGMSGVATVAVVAVVVLPALVIATAVGVVLPRIAAALLGPSAAEAAVVANAEADRVRRQNVLARALQTSISRALALTSDETGRAAGILDADPDAARAALGRAERALRAAAADLVYSFTVLRGPSMATGDVDPVPERPLTDLDDLIEESRQAGLDIRLNSEGDLERVPAALSTAAFRIVEDSVTRALRHASPPQASLRCAVSADALEINLFNPAEGMPRDGDGIDSIRERVEFLGGRCVIGATGDGWLVRVVLPTHHAFT